MTNLFDFKNYKDFVLFWVRSQPKAGHGQFKRIAEYLGVGSVLISQIFNGDRELSTEQALELAEFFNLLEIEKKYFVLLVRKARAGSKKLRDHIESEIQEVLSQSKKLKERIKTKSELSNEDQATFYSSWHYSALRLATDIPSMRNLKSLAEHFSLDIEMVKASMEFLIERGLCVLENGELKMGPRIVFLASESPHIQARQMSWRLKAMDQMGLKDKEDLFFTCPLVCSAETKQILRNKIIALVNEVIKEVKESPSEELSCLNIDWFGF